MENINITPCVLQDPEQQAALWFETRDGQRIYFFTRAHLYRHKINLETMQMLCDYNDSVTVDGFVGLLQLRDSGILTDECYYYEECDYDTDYYPDNITTKAQEKEICQSAYEFFHQHGYDVTMKAIRHNFDGWMCDYKTGYRDEKRGYHLFSACGCNKLAFRLTTLWKGASGWQTTYDI